MCAVCTISPKAAAHCTVHSPMYTTLDQPIVNRLPLPLAVDADGATKNL